MTIYLEIYERPTFSNVRSRGNRRLGTSSVLRSLLRSSTVGTCLRCRYHRARILRGLSLIQCSSRVASWIAFGGRSMSIRRFHKVHSGMPTFVSTDPVTIRARPVHGALMVMFGHKSLRTDIHRRKAYMLVRMVHLTLMSVLARKPRRKNRLSLVYVKYASPLGNHGNSL